VLLGVIRQKSMRRFQERSAQVDALSGGIETFVAVVELFAVTAGNLLAILISTGSTLLRRDYHD
jgi:hypothetical protein